VACFICGAAAVWRVVVTKIDGSTTRYLACDGHAPTHIPGGDVVTIRSTQI
jgi:hypothetical protein